MTHEETFQACIEFILPHEGGLSIDRRDPGGITHWGISLRYLRSIGLDPNGDGKVTDEDIIGLLRQDAIEIYRKNWWDKYNYSCFNDLIVVEKVFDLAVNMGAFGAHKILQIAVNRLQWFPVIPLEVDGILGFKTFSQANTCNENELRQELRECARDRYKEILAANPAMGWCRKGWMNRAEM